MFSGSSTGNVTVLEKYFTDLFIVLKILDIGYGILYFQAKRQEVDEIPKMKDCVCLWERETRGVMW